MLNFGRRALYDKVLGHAPSRSSSFNSLSGWCFGLVICGWFVGETGGLDSIGAMILTAAHNFTRIANRNTLRVGSKSNVYCTSICCDVGWEGNGILAICG